MSQSQSSILEPLQLGPISLRNRVVKAATYETRSKDSLMTAELIDWHRRIAAGGAAMTTLAYCAVSSDGRTFRDQIWMRPEAVPGLAKFTQAMHEEGAAAAVQLGHAGWFADPKATGVKPAGPSKQISPHAKGFSRAMTEDDFERVLEDYARSAELAVEAGFDGIEVHVGHGYLLSQFLSPYNNKRTDRWGGDSEARARFPRLVLKTIKERVGDRAAIWAKLNMDDGFRGGLTIEESLAFAQAVESDGSLDAIQLTGGHTTRSPMYLMRGDSPLAEVLAPKAPKLIRRVIAAAGTLVLKNYAFEEAWFLPQALRFRQAVDLPLMLLGGITQAATMQAARDAGFEMVALGRALIAEPDLVNQLAQQQWAGSICTHCNRCVGGVGRKPAACVLPEAELLSS
jgi:2,4-dienoyl-CoA reductase-like NADH-dependent reductase (Old Yellow Enzyme family)